MRLIDADALIEEIKSLQVFVTGLRAGKGVLNEYAKQYRESLLRIVDEHPTAYNVDAVVEQMKEAESVKNFGSVNSRNLLIPLNDAVAIVRKGSVE